MDVIKIEPDSDEEANATLLSIEQDSIVKESGPLPFMFCAVKNENQHCGDPGADEEEGCEEGTVRSSAVAEVTDAEVCGTREEAMVAESDVCWDRIRSVSGRPLNGQAREIVYNVATYLQNQKKEFNLSYNVANSTSEATGVSAALVYGILREARALKTKGCLKFTTPCGKKNSRKKKIPVDDFVREAIKRKIQEFYTVKKTVPTLTTLNQSLKEDGIIDCGREFLRLTLKSLGFTWHKTQSKRKMISDGGIDDAVATQQNCSNSGSDVSETSMECSSDECA